LATRIDCERPEYSSKVQQQRRPRALGERLQRTADVRQDDVPMRRMPRIAIIGSDRQLAARSHNVLGHPVDPAKLGKNHRPKNTVADHEAKGRESASGRLRLLR
jgi:hypothetical protein